MRLRQRDLKEFKFREYGTFKEPDGTSYKGYGPDLKTIKGKIQPAGGKMLSEMYGLKLNYMLTLYCEDVTALTENDGVYVDNTEDKDPDYKVVAIRKWDTAVVDLEKV